MKLKLNQYVGLLGIGLLTGTTVLPVVQVSAATTSDVTPTYTASAQLAYNTANNLVNVAKQSKSTPDIEKAYEAFIAITPELNSQNYAAYQEHDEMDQIFFSTIDLLYNVTPEKDKNAEIERFAKLWSDTLKKNTNSLYVYHFRYFVMKNQIPAIQNDLNSEMEDLNRYANGVPSDHGIIPLPTEAEMDKMLNDYYNKYGGDQPDPQAPTDSQTQSQINQQYPQKSGSDLVSQTIRYEKHGNDWYEITDTISNGKRVKSSSRKMTVAESYWLRVQQDPSYDPNAGAVNNINNDTVTNQEWNYLTTSQNPESKYTIQYTVNKDADTPYYYDTGIRVNQQKEATYEQYCDILKILVDKAGGYLVEDNNKILVVLEGKPIVVEDKKKLYSKNDLETLFANFKKVDIRIMETRIGQTGSLEEQIVSKQAKTVQVDKKVIKLQTLPMVADERALLPMNEIVQALGGTVKQDKDSFTITKGSTQVIFRLKDSSVYVNGKAIKLNNAPTYKGNILMVESSDLATALGYSMSWDGETSTIHFDKN